MELRTHSARTTKDIDLTPYDWTLLSKDSGQRREQVRAMLQEAAATRLNDYFEFVVGEAREDLDGAPEGGSRYPVQVQMDGRDFARFHVDVGIGDEVLEPLDVVAGAPVRCGYALDHFRLLVMGGLARGSAPACIASSVPRPEATPSFLWKTSRKVRGTM